MANRYDKQTTTFSQQGRLYQVEYAIAATKDSGPALGVLGQDCVLLVGEKKVSAKLLDQTKQPEKLFEIDDHICCAVAGVTSDANTLLDKLRLDAQRYTYQYGEPIPVEQLVIELSDYKQSYTQHGGLRPFGVSFLFVGYDRHHGFQLYHTDPAGQYCGWRAHAVGSWDTSTTTSTLKQEWKADMPLNAVKELVGKVMVKNGDASTADAEKFEMAVITKGEDGAILYERVSKEEVDRILTAAKAKEEAETPAGST